jgi:hypothetical protein
VRGDGSYPLAILWDFGGANFSISQRSRIERLLLMAIGTLAAEGTGDLVLMVGCAALEVGGARSRRSTGKLGSLADDA